MLTDDAWTRLRELTEARIALGRAGHALPTAELLAFQLAHAQARDAVHRPLDVTRFKHLQPVMLKSAARDRPAYLRRPDLGRKLAPDTELTRGDWDAVILIADGLSAQAVEQFAPPMVESLRSNLPDWRFAPICVVEQGRVAIGDEIGGRLGARMVVMLIGERPGLSSPSSMGAYFTWDPHPGRTDAERNCISNIRARGLDVRVAAQRAAVLMQAAKAAQITGVDLQLGISDSADDRTRVSAPPV